MDALSHMDKFTKYYAVQQQRDTKDNVQYNSTHMKFQKDKSNLIESKSVDGGARDGVGNGLGRDTKELLG